MTKIPLSIILRRISSGGSTFDDDESPAYLKHIAQNIVKLAVSRLGLGHWHLFGPKKTLAEYNLAK